ncbi:MAG: MFS transporter, partial [Bifidobacteriaceae bacterium]|nr:MFS transporter [Bifidobacteriaceae bacterium]
YNYGEKFSVGATSLFFVGSFILSFFVVAQRRGARTTGARAPKAARPPLFRYLGSRIFERAAIPGGVLLLLFAITQGVQQSYLPVMCDGRGLKSGVSYYFIVSAIFALVSRPTLGRWADRRGYTGPTVFACVGLVAGMLVVSQAYNLPMLLLGAVLQGLTYSSGFSVFLSMSTRNAPIVRRGIASATAMIGFDFGNGFGAVALGALVSLGGYSLEFYGAALAAAIALLMYFCYVRRRIA